MSLRRDFIKFPLAAATTAALALCGASALAQPAPVTLLNVSYDPTRELYVEYNAAFAKYWKAKTGQDVTRACLACHKDAATDLMKTSHWTWESKPVSVPWRAQPVTLGKANQINNFCIGAQGNENKCTACHAGYGWEAGRAEQQKQPDNVDCLACHADPGLYGKGLWGNPAPSVDLLAAARSVRATTRENCGKCHFDGGGGNGVKHGDLDQSLNFPARSLDVHMGGKHSLQCSDCHVTNRHQIKGRLIADNVTIDPAEQVSCEQCHTGRIHRDERIASHLRSVAETIDDVRIVDSPRRFCFVTGVRRPTIYASTAALRGPRRMALKLRSLPALPTSTACAPIASMRSTAWPGSSGCGSTLRSA